MIHRKPARQNYYITILTIVAVFLLSYLFAIRGATQDTIRRDELTTLGHIGALEKNNQGLSLQQTIDSLANYSAQHPPFYYLQANIWGTFLSYDSYILRLLSVFWGILTLAVFYRLSFDIAGHTVAVYASFLMGTSLIFLFYTHEIREYASLMFWGVLTWWMYYRFSRQTRPLSWRQLCLLTLVTGATIYTHYSSIFLLVPIGIYHLFFVKKNRAWWQITIAVIIAGVLYLPWFPTLITGFTQTMGKVDTGDSLFMSNPELIPVTVQFWGNGSVILFVVLVGLGMMAVALNRRGSRYVLFFCVMMTLVVLILNGQLEFVKRLRYIMITLLPFYLFGAIGLAMVGRWHIIPTAFFIAWLSFGTSFLSKDEYKAQTGLLGANQFLEYHRLLPIMNQQATADDILVIVITDYAVLNKSKHDKESIEAYYLSFLNKEMESIHIFPGNPNYAIANYKADVETKHAIWLTYRTDITLPDEVTAFRQLIEDTHQLCQSIPYGESSRVDEYVLRDQFDHRCNT